MWDDRGIFFVVELDVSIVHREKRKNSTGKLIGLGFINSLYLLNG